MFRQAALASLLSLTVSSYALPQENYTERAAGFVAELSGKWRLFSDAGQSTPVKLGMAIPPNSLVQIEGTKTEFGKIRIAKFDGTVQTCEQEKSCSRLTISQTPEESRGITERLKAVLYRFFSEPPRKYISALSRNSSNQFQETILDLGAENTDITSIIKNSSKPELRLLLQKRTRHTEWATLSEVVVASKAPLIASGTLNPGLYRIIELDAKSSEPTGNESWALLVLPRDREKITESFKTLKALAEKWSPELTSDLQIRRMLRIQLEILSESR